jgi:hypothetical protein
MQFLHSGGPTPSLISCNLELSMQYTLSNTCPRGGARWRSGSHTTLQNRQVAVSIPDGKKVKSNPETGLRGLEESGSLRLPDF